MKIETEGRQLFNVPNTAEGKKFLKLLTVYKNSKSKYKLKKRGRSSDRKEAFKRHGKESVYSSTRQSYVPFQTSEWVAVYVSKNR